MKDDAARVRRAALSIGALGGWVLLQVIATAYARGAGGDRPASRYMDTLGFGMAVNALALGWLLSRSDGSPRAIQVRRGIAVAWAVTLLGGMGHIALLGWREELPGTTRYLRAAEALTRAYLMTGDKRNLQSDDIPYPNADSLSERLTQPSLAQLMPLSVRPPLPLVPAKRDPRFLENQVTNLELEVQREKAPRAGLSPTTAPLASFRSWGSFIPSAEGDPTVAEWRSGPVAPGPLRGWLKFETSGHVGDPAAGGAIALQLVDAATGKLLADVKPSRVPGNSWRAAYVPAPRQPFVVVARDADPARWLGFSEPVEMSTLSYWAWRATQHSVLLFWVTVGVTLALAVISWLKGRRIISCRPTASSSRVADSV